MATYKFSNNNQIQSFPVANIFIDKYLPSANATFVKVYLYGLRQCFQNNNQLANKDIAAALNILESDVVNAWRYWESVGVVKLNKQIEGHLTEFDIDFIDLTSEPQSNTNKVSHIEIDSRPNYTPEEISIYIEQDKNIRFLYQAAQAKLGKMLSSADIKTLYSFYDWLRLPVEVIIMLLEYCASLNKKSMRYIEKVAISWADQGIISMDKAEQYLMKVEHKNTILYDIKKQLGIVDRALTEAEEGYIVDWTDRMNLTVELIKLAYEITVLNTGKLTFPYMNSILQSWYERGIRTVEAAENDIKQHRENTKDKYAKKSTNSSGAKNNKFINFTQRKHNFNEIERLLLEKRLNNLKEESR
ncbi:DnaD domain protein [Petroclostridium sp. X23]|jgi:DnaD/phage-associated family protein|uniref:DnaD domain protein n=1 Tax=Petroclostridium sp. X23 TaxID=3045146 RepID=UPI0024ADE6E9|nr:DnaD domain protein [Petroclostridium sp. X23]WHH57266.1 DnaD domain protein [Petroclostridium sp. X23]